MTIWAAIFSLFLLVKVSYQNQADVCLAPRSMSTVAIYSGRAFHEEVTAAFACAYFALGHNVTVYMDDTIRIMDIPLPFTSKRIADGVRYYGRCVQNWVSTCAAVQLSPATELLIMTTYPMKVNRRTSDETAYRLIQQISAQRLSARLLLVTHRAKPKFWKHLDRITPFVPPSRISFVFLAEHVHHTADTLRSPIERFPNAVHIHPAVPLHLLVDRDYTLEFNAMHSTGNRSVNATTYAIQGHFGGRHSKRRDVPAAVSCLHSVAATASTPQLRLVGRGADAADVGHSHRNVRVTRHSNLDSLAFYFQVAKSTYLLTAIGSSNSSNSTRYETEKATSSIPLALTLGIPLVSTRSLLGLYTCLRDSAVVMALAAETDCDSVILAQSLSAAEVDAVRGEMRRCAGELWQQALNTLAGLTSRSEGDNGTEGVHEDCPAV